MSTSAFENNKCKDTGVKRGILNKEGRLVSVIVPVYNVEKYLSRCLKSLTDQVYKSIEIIVVDDGSTDKSSAIAERFAHHDNRIRVFHKRNGGQGSARNVGLDNAKGDYYCFVDSDDWVDKDYVLKMVSCLEANNADIVMCGVERVWDNGTRVRNKISNNKEYVVPDVHQFLFHASYVSCDKIYKKELFNNLRYSEIRTFEDYATIPLVLARAKKIIGIPDTLYYYFWRVNSTTNVKKADFNILNAQRLLENSEFKQFQDVLASYYVRNVIGSLVWSLCSDLRNRSVIEGIVKEGQEKYPELQCYVTSDNIGYPFWGKLVLSNRLLEAILLQKAIDNGKNVFRPIYHHFQYMKRNYRKHAK